MVRQVSSIRWRNSSKVEIIPEVTVFGDEPSPFYRDEDGQWWNRETGEKCIEMTIKEFLGMELERDESK